MATRQKPSRAKARAETKKYDAIGKIIEGILKLKNPRLDRIVAKSMKDYGTYVIEERALPDIRDGLKPVQRRILWSMYELRLHNNGGTTKSAVVVSQANGYYHPHGDQSCYSALVNITNSIDIKTGKITSHNIPVGLSTGQGNFGDSLGNPPAQMRYTEVKLSDYSDRFMLNPEYLSVTQMIPNYLGTKTEPLILPSLLPNILLNGCRGIAVGVATHIPPFKMKGVLKLVRRRLKGKKIRVKDCLKHLKFNYPTNPVLKEHELKTYYSTGRGRVVFSCPYELDVGKKKMVLLGVPPEFDIEKLTEKLYRSIDAVSSVDDLSGSSEIRIEIGFKQNTSKKELEAAVAEIDKKILRSSISYNTNVTIRNIAEDVETTEATAKFESVTVPRIIEYWTDWRIQLELDSLKYKRDRLKEQIDYQKLLKFAISKIDIIVKVIKSKSKDLNADLAKALKVDIEKAKIILDMPVRRLSRLSEEEIDNRIDKLQAELKQIKKWIKNPNDKILTDLKGVKITNR